MESDEEDKDLRHDIGPENEAGGDPTDGEAGPLSDCSKRWKAASPEATKISLGCWDQTGIFAGACRHGMVIKACEMVRSGELCVFVFPIEQCLSAHVASRRAKYGLSVVEHFLQTHTESRSALAVDIGCSFQKTIRSSRLVGPIAADRGLYVLVNAFHGWAHNRTCQLQHHPLYTPGIGIEDLEGMERLFSWTNNVAATVRGASRYHWLQAYDLCLKQWDEDKYSNICVFGPMPRY